MDSENISDKLNALANGKNRSATARLREIFDDIEKALHAGAHRKDVYQTLIENGFEITFESFELAVYRIRKKRKEQKEPTERSVRRKTREKSDEQDSKLDFRNALTASGEVNEEFLNELTEETKKGNL